MIGPFISVDCYWRSTGLWTKQRLYVVVDWTYARSTAQITPQPPFYSINYIRFVTTSGT